MNLSFQVVDLPLKHTFTIAHQSRDVQDTILVKLQDGALYGLGESTTNPFYGMTITNMSECLEKFRPIVEKREWETPAELWGLGLETFKDNPFAQCALDLAAWDLYAKKQGKKLYELLALNPADIPLTNYPRTAKTYRCCF